MTQNKCPGVLLLLRDEKRRSEAEKLAQMLGLDIVTQEQPWCDQYLVLAENYVGLRSLDLGKQKDMFVDFVGGTVGHRHRQGEGRGQTLAKAIGIRGNEHPSVLDVTAGLGRDAFVLASLGCKVTLVERSPYLYALLVDGLRRAEEDEFTRRVVENMTLFHSDSTEFLAQLGQAEQTDVIYLDPMYPHRQKSALVKKEMRVIRAFVGDDEDTEALLGLALGRARQRIVVKRPKGAPNIGPWKVNYTLESKNTRYDVYLPQ